MAYFFRASSMALLLAGGLALAGCAGDGNDNIFATGALGTTPQQPQQQAAAPEPKVDPACVTLTSRIDALRKEGIGEKIEKAAAKKYKMTQADLSKADQLTKASADFQMRCSTITPRPTTAQSTYAPQTAATTPAPARSKAATKSTATATP